MLFESWSDPPRTDPICVRKSRNGSLLEDLFASYQLQKSAGFGVTIGRGLHGMEVAAAVWVLGLAATAVPTAGHGATTPNHLAALRAKPLAGPAEFDGKTLTLVSGNLSFRLDEETVRDPKLCQKDDAGFLALGYGIHPQDVCLTVMATVTVDGKTVAQAPSTFLSTGPDIAELRLTAEIIRLSPGTDQPQIFITGWTGGMHCCTVSAVATDDGGKWRFAFLGRVDGDGWQVLNLAPGGPPVFVGYDQSFYYAWASYAGSYAPTLLQVLRGDKLRDVTKDPVYRPFLLDRLHEMEHSRDGSEREPNGYLAGWVGQKALVGQFSPAWKTMLANYDKGATTTRCAIDQDSWPTPPGETPMCPKDQEIQIAFPEALALDLAEKGYITNDQAAAVGVDPIAVTAKRRLDMEVATDAYRKKGLEHLQ